ncbi:MAG TPA: DUF2203 domain-containing protein [Acidobacteriaceae bacterium]|nr:DUF2203 domain-containing protein [Acidobacteriaceae bacterium]
MRTFTHSEAQTMLPVLEALLRRAIAANAKAVALEEEMQQLNQRIFLAGGMNVDVAAAVRRRGEREIAIREAKDTLAEIDAIGVQVKDLNAGLLDFPCKMEGEIVLLCWKLGEKEITHWHTVEAGFSGRQPLDDRFKGEKPQ